VLARGSEAKAPTDLTLTLSFRARRYDLDAALDPHNSGVLIVQLQSAGNGGLPNGHAGAGNGRARGRALGSELESKNGECTIM
jgi:hypothetical protein